MYMENPNLKKYKYTVGILIYHRTPKLVEMAKDCLRSVLVNIDRNETEIIICDNGSTIKDTFWEEHADTYIRFDKNMGISRGWNSIIKLARGKYINILGDDTKVRPGWLDAMQKAMDMPDCGIANIHVEHLPPNIGVIENYKWFSHACFMLTQNTIDKVGYYREDLYFPGNWEDTDYIIRVYKAGLKTYVNYGKTIQHLEGQTVHAKDIAGEFNRLKQVFIREHGFDPVEALYGSEDLYDKLGIAK